MYKIEVTTESKWVAQKITNLLSTLERLGNWGASRRVAIDWDGDGSEKICVSHTDMVPEFEKNWCDKKWVYVSGEGINSAVI